jgi:putative transposase
VDEKSEILAAFLALIDVERWVESCRRDLLNHVISVNGKHLKRLLAEYVRYYHEDRTHLGLAKDTPAGRA